MYLLEPKLTHFVHNIVFAGAIAFVDYEDCLTLSTVSTEVLHKCFLVVSNTLLCVDHQQSKVRFVGSRDCLSKHILLHAVDRTGFLLASHGLLYTRSINQP